MSVASEIRRIQAAKEAIRQAIQSKGVSVPKSAGLEQYPMYIDMIENNGYSGGQGGH